MNSPGRSNLPSIILATAVIAMLAFILTYEECDVVCSDWDFASDLLLDTRKIERWDRSPLVVVSDGSLAEVQMVRGAVYELNQILSDTSMILHFDTQGPADIDVEFVPNDRMDHLGTGHDLDAGILGFSQNFLLHDGRLDAARIFVSRDLEQGDKWGTVLHELGHAMGITGHTDRYLSSLFYEDWKGGALSDRYSPDDRKLLRFLYRHLDPGVSKLTVRKEFDNNWVLRSR